MLPERIIDAHHFHSGMPHEAQFEKYSADLAIGPEPRFSFNHRSRA